MALATGSHMFATRVLPLAASAVRTLTAYLSDACDPNGGLEQCATLVRRDGTITVHSHSTIQLGGSRAGCTGK